MLFLLLFHDNGLVAFFARTFHGADTTAFAVVVIEVQPFFIVYRDR